MILFILFTLPSLGHSALSTPRPAPITTTTVILLGDLTEGEEQNYKVNCNGTCSIRVVMEVDSGDADIFAKEDGLPEILNFDCDECPLCKANSTDLVETCNIQTNQSNHFFLTILAFEDFTNGKLTVTGVTLTNVQTLAVCKDIKLDCVRNPYHCIDPKYYDKCQNTCGCCAPDRCLDDSTDMCTMFPDQCFMDSGNKTCPRFCGSCKSCEDILYSDLCTELSEECDNTLVKYFCSKTCKVCDERCRNLLRDDAACNGYAHRGLCSREKTRDLCKKACNDCLPKL